MRQPDQGEDNAMNEDEAIDSGKYSKYSSSLSSYRTATCESSSKNVTPIQVPHTQVMERPTICQVTGFQLFIFEKKTLYSDKQEGYLQ